jgi:GNAT superfamily N-acetyltransferase
MAGGRAGGPVLIKWPVVAGAQGVRDNRALRCGWVEDLAVEPKRRRVGVGRALMEHLEDLARGRGLTRGGPRAGVDEGYAAARRLYESLGYTAQEVGRSLSRRPRQTAGMWMSG